MPELRCPGLRATKTSTYLAALGLLDVLGRCGYPEATLEWDGEMAVFHGPETVEKILLNEYQPTPIVSPWNGGSGFGEKDKAPRDSLEKIMSIHTQRMESFRSTISIARDVHARSIENNWKKERLVTALRNELPDEALSWLDAATVVTASPEDTKLLFPPLLGTGGNDGRLDFSANFHKQLISVLPELGGNPARSRAWFLDAVYGTTHQKMASAPIGQFDPQLAGTPRSSIFGSADSSVNPWIYVLMMEGLTFFAASSVRRLGESTRQASIPWTVRYAEGGGIPGSDLEESRGEVWLPTFKSPLRSRDVAALFHEAKTSWGGESATNAAHLYGALSSGGVSATVTHMYRYAILQRNGLAFVTELLDVVENKTTEGVELSIELETQTNRWRGRGTSQESARRNVHARILEFNRNPAPERLLALLAAVSQQELSVNRGSAARRESYPISSFPTWRRYLSPLTDLMNSQPELQVAASLASSTFASHNKEPGYTPLRRLLLGMPAMRARDWESPKITGVESRPLVDLLCDIASWQVGRGDLASTNVGTGITLRAEAGLRIDPKVSAAWLNGLLDEEHLRFCLLAMMALDWGGCRRELKPPSIPDSPSADLTLLGMFANGRVLTASAPTRPDRTHLVGFTSRWVPELIRGDTHAVSSDAVVTFERSGRVLADRPYPHLDMIVERDVTAFSASDGRRLLASLMTYQSPASPNSHSTPKENTHVTTN